MQISVLFSLLATLAVSRPLPGLFDSASSVDISGLSQEAINEIRLADIADGIASDPAILAAATVGASDIEDDGDGQDDIGGDSQGDGIAVSSGSVGQAGIDEVPANEVINSAGINIAADLPTE
ncbi:hypothetical protein HDV03_002058 [Kappamyces sp. JEL0829]|nr:hypothetical protein HDV03_002058 [Kappamyces sp. JEL0829]